MGIVGKLLTLPVMGPIDGVLWLAQKIKQQVDAERWNEGKIVEALAELEIDLDIGRIDTEEYDRKEVELLQELKRLQEEKNGREF
jgi:hypothetical protein